LEVHLLLEASLKALAQKKPEMDYGRVRTLVQQMRVAIPLSREVVVATAMVDSTVFVPSAIGGFLRRIVHHGTGT
jgi:hypothetical protein